MTQKSSQIHEMIKTKERFDAIQKLLELKILLPFNSDFQTFHGRANVDGKEFTIKPNFNNIRDPMGNMNINGVPGLHTAKFEIASKYAEARTKMLNKTSAKEENSSLSHVEKPVLKNAERPISEVHRIVPKKSNLFVANLCNLYNEEEFDFAFFKETKLLSEEEIKAIKAQQLTKEQKQEAKQAVCLLASCYTLKDILPKLFKNPLSTQIYCDLQKICNKNKATKGVARIFDLDVEKYIKYKGFEQKKLQKLVEHLARGENSLQMLLDDGDLRTFINKFQRNIDFSPDCMLSQEFEKEFLKRVNIVGVYQKIWVSNVINTKNFEGTFFFDTRKIEAKKIEEDYSNTSLVPPK